MQAKQAEKKTRIVIVGGGFGGAYCAKRLQQAARERGDLEVLLIDKKNYMIFTPLLVEAGTGSLEPRHAVVPIRDFVKGTNFLMAEVESVDCEQKQIHCAITGTAFKRTISYDHLVIAPGSVTKMLPIPGLSEYAFEMKTIADSVALRDRGIQMLEIANSIDDVDKRRALLHFVVVGANYTGVEAAGEYLVFLREASKRFSNLCRDDVRVTIIEVQDRILPALDEELSLFAAKVLKDRGADILLKTTVKEVHAEKVVLDNDQVLNAHTVLWTAGIAPAPLIGELDFEKDKRGYLICEPDLRVKGQDCVWALGDSAINPGPDESPYPPTAQHATRQGTQAAENILRVLKGESTKPCEIKSQGSLAALGCRTGVAKVFGLKLSGFPAWFLWRTVYLMKMPTASRRIRVALDWTLDLFLKTDIVQLGVHRVRVRTDVPAPPQKHYELSGQEDLIPANGIGQLRELQSQKS